MRRFAATCILWPLLFLWDTVSVLIAITCAVPLTFIRGAYSITTLPDLVHFLRGIPCGQSLQRFLIMFVSPYAATIRCRITKLTHNTCVAEMDDWPWLRNPFASVHAVAIANLAELTSGLAMISALHAKGLRGIPTRIDCRYWRKARGSLLATCSVSVPEKPGLYKCFVNVLDQQHFVVCEAAVEWTVAIGKTKTT